MRPTTQLAKKLRSALEKVAQTAGISTHGLKLSISSQHTEPYCVGNTIRLPGWMAEEGEDFGMLARSFLHELQHASDVRSGVDLPREQMELRARKAERSYLVGRSK